MGMDRRIRSSEQWPEATYVNLENEPSNHYPRTSYAQQNGLHSAQTPNNFENFSIPRPKYYERRQAQRTFTETYVQDTPANEMIERISDEFRFLEQRDNTFQLGSNPQKIRHQKLSYNKYLFVAFAILQIIVSIGLLVFACIRHFQLFNRTNTNALLDFVKVEDYVSSNQDGTDLIAIKLGTSIFLPALLQLLAGFTGLYPLRRRPPKSLYVLNIIFAGLSILLWFRPIVYAIFELNLRNIQLDNISTSTNHWLLSIVLFLFSLDIFVINGVLLIYANLHLSSSIRTLNHVLDIHVSMLAIIMSFLCIGTSIYAVAFTMTNVAEWGQEQRNIASLYGFGIRELIISFFLFLIACFNCSAIVTRRKNMRQTALTLQILGLLCLFYELLNEDRLLAASHNIRVMFNQGITEPIIPEIILLLYTFIVVLTIILTIQVFSTTMNVFKAPVCDIYTPTVATVQPIAQVHSSL